MLRVARVYSTYEAKARLSEILRKVRSGQKVAISHRGEIVAEVAPVEASRQGFAQRIKRMEAEGIVAPPRGSRRPFPRLARRPGGLKRFLESRD